MQNFWALSVQPGSLITHKLESGGWAFNSTHVNAGFAKPSDGLPVLTATLPQPFYLSQFYANIWRITCSRAVQFCFSLLPGPLPQPCSARSSARPRSIQAWSPSLYLLEPEVLGQCCMSHAWHCSIQMSVGTERTQNPGTNWVPMSNTSSTQWM